MKVGLFSSSGIRKGRPGWEGGPLLPSEVPALKEKRGSGTEERHTCLPEFGVQWRGCPGHTGGQAALCTADQHDRAISQDCGLPRSPKPSPFMPLLKNEPQGTDSYLLQ